MRGCGGGDGFRGWVEMERMLDEGVGLGGHGDDCVAVVAG